MLDATYKVTTKAVIYLFGRTEDGKRIIVKDNFEPYFWVLAMPGQDPTPALEQLTLAKGKVVRVERVKKKLNEHEIDALKVFVDLPQNVPSLREACRKLPEVRDVLEADILFVRRYLIDKGLTPFTLIEADCEPTTESARAEVFEATEVRQVSDETLAKPKIIALDIETYNPQGRRSLPEQHPIVMLALYGEGLKKVLTWKKVEGAECLDSESEMLERAKKIIDDYEPDIITTYFGDGFDLPYLKTRADKYKIKLDLSWEFSELKIGGRDTTVAEFTGLTHLDVLPFVRRVMSKGMQTDSYTLDNVAKELLGEEKKKVDIERLADHWDKNDPSLAEFAKYNLHDAKLTHDLLLKILPNMIEIVKLVGILPSDATRMSFSQLVEWFIIRQASLANELVPNRPGRRDQAKREAMRFKGAIVIEPKPGMYEDIAVFDYRSLYPSIIASHNISPGMLNCSCCEGKDMVPDTQMWFCKRRRGFLARIIEDIITHRARIKKLLKENKDPLLVARSEGLKVLANAFYGYLGFAPARWYCFECGQATTAWARFHIQEVVRMANDAGFKVLYGDTDSAFLQLNGKTREEAAMFADKVNSTLPGLMELELESFFTAGMFVSTKTTEAGAKKRYALIDDNGKLKIRGFEVVRRNVSPVARRVQREVLVTILKDKDVAKAQRIVMDAVEALRKNALPIEDVVIKTALTRNIDQYEAKGPHVAAAERMRDSGVPVGQGTRIEYIITKRKGLIRDRVRLPQESTQDDYDGEYYADHQVLPAVERIFEVMGVDIHAATTPKNQSTLGSF